MSCHIEHILQIKGPLYIGIDSKIAQGGRFALPYPIYKVQIYNTQIQQMHIVPVPVKQKQTRGSYRMLILDV